MTGDGKDERNDCGPNQPKGDEPTLVSSPFLWSSKLMLLPANKRDAGRVPILALFKFSGSAEREHSYELCCPSLGFASGSKCPYTGRCTVLNGRAKLESVVTSLSALMHNAYRVGHVSSCPIWALRTAVSNQSVPK